MGAMLAVLITESVKATGAEPVVCGLLSDGRAGARGVEGNGAEPVVVEVVMVVEL